jgi:hypothetical protein
MIVIPLQAAPSQSFNVTLNGQACQIALYQKGELFYIDLSIGSKVIRQGRMVRNATRLVRYAYLGFIGDLVMFDTQGHSDPTYDGLGVRYQLYYLSPDELSAKAAA